MTYNDQNPYTESYFQQVRQLTEAAIEFCKIKRLILDNPLPKRVQLHLDYFIAENNYSYFLTHYEPTITTSSQYRQEFGITYYIASDGISDEKKIQIINNLENLILSMIKVYGISLDLETLDLSDNVDTIMNKNFLDKANIINPAYASYSLSLVSPNNPIDPTQLDDTQFITSGSMTVDVTKKNEDVSESKFPDSEDSKRITDNNKTDDISVDKSEIDYVVNKNQNDVPIEFGRILKLGDAQIKCNLLTEYSFLEDSQLIVIPNKIFKRDNSSSIELGYLLSNCIINGDLDDFRFRSLNTLVVHYASNFARETMIGQLSLVNISTPIESKPVVMPNFATKDQIELKRNGKLYWLFIQSYYISRHITTTKCRDLAEPLLFELMHKTGMFLEDDTNDIIQDVTSPTNVEFVMRNREVSYRDVTYASAGINFEYLFSNPLENLLSIRVILSSIAITTSFSMKLEVEEGTQEMFEKWTLFPLKEVAPSSTVRMTYPAIYCSLLILKGLIEMS